MPLHALGNPFPVVVGAKPGEKGSREWSVDYFSIWLAEKLEARDKEVCKAMNTLVLAVHKIDVLLSCFCKPKLCHTDVLVGCVKCVLSGGTRRGIIEGSRTFAWRTCAVVSS